MDRFAGWGICCLRVFRLPSDGQRVGSECPPYATGLVRKNVSRRGFAKGFRLKVGGGVFRLPLDGQRVGSKCPPYANRCGAEKCVKGGVCKRFPFESGRRCFQAAFGWVTRGQQVPTLRNRCGAKKCVKGGVCKGFPSENAAVSAVNGLCARCCIRFCPSTPWPVRRRGSRDG